VDAVFDLAGAAEVQYERHGHRAPVRGRPALSADEFRGLAPLHSEPLHMPDSAAPLRSPHPIRRIAWRIGWVLLALVSLCITYSLLVVGGR
jgi:hypothetical protein